MHPEAPPQALLPRPPFQALSIHALSGHSEAPPPSTVAPPPSPGPAHLPIHALGGHAEAPPPLAQPLYFRGLHATRAQRQLLQTLRLQRAQTRAWGRGQKGRGISRGRGLEWAGSHGGAGLYFIAKAG